MPRNAAKLLTQSTGDCGALVAEPQPFRPQRLHGPSMKRLISPILCAFLFLGSLVSSGAAQTERAVPTRRYELRGKLLLPPGTVRPRRWITVNLLAVGSPFYSRAIIQPDGRFRFKDLDPGTYTILFLLPRVGQLTRTVELTQSFADAKGRIEIQFEYTPELLALTLRPDERATVSVRELQISYSARREFEKAQARLRQKDADKAIAHLTKAIEEAPEFQEAINSLGIIYFQRSQYAEAEKYFRMALKFEPDAFEPTVNLGGVLLTQGKGKEALEVNQRAYDTLPQDALASAQLGFSYFLMGDNGQAIRYLEQAKELDPAHFTFPQITLAQIFMRLGQPEDAVEEITEFLRLHPDSAEVERVQKLQQAAEIAIRDKARAEAAGEGY